MCQKPDKFFLCIKDLLEMSQYEKLNFCASDSAPINSGNNRTLLCAQDMYGAQPFLSIVGNEQFVIPEQDFTPNQAVIWLPIRNFFLSGAHLWSGSRTKLSKNKSNKLKKLAKECNFLASNIHKECCMEN